MVLAPRRSQLWNRTRCLPSLVPRVLVAGETLMSEKRLSLLMHTPQVLLWASPPRTLALMLQVLCLLQQRMRCLVSTPVLLLSRRWRVAVLLFLLQ